MATTYEFSANGTVFGRYSGETVQEACDAFARDAGYASYSAMLETLGDPSEDNVELQEVMENGRLGTARNAYELLTA